MCASEWRIRSTILDELCKAEVEHLHPDVSLHRVQKRPCCPCPRRGREDEANLDCRTAQLAINAYQRLCWRVRQLLGRRALEWQGLCVSLLWRPWPFAHVLLDQREYCLAALLKVRKVANRDDRAKLRSVIVRVKVAEPLNIPIEHAFHALCVAFAANRQALCKPLVAPYCAKILLEES